MKVAIIGGGAAGLMTAVTIAETNPAIELFLIERNAELGKKVLISGGGRCNVTTGIHDMRTLFSKYPRGAKFLSSALYGFPPAAVVAWFESHGVPLKTESDLRVFPVSDDGHEVVRAFEKVCAHAAVSLLHSHAVTRVEKRDKTFVIHFKTQAPLTVDQVVIATGGQAYRHTGSQGDGYTFAEALGHSITPLAPSLSSFISSDAWVKELAGISWEHAEFQTDRAGFPPVQGPFLFTHHGVTGPALFALSALIAYEPITPQKPLTLFINFFPSLTRDACYARIKQTCATYAKRSAENIVATFVPKSLAKKMCLQTSLAPEKHGGEIHKKEMELLCDTMRGLPVHLIGRGAGDEFVTAGGVALTEVNPSTMESKLTPGLFFAGEILNIDGFTGGFNLQASWATGRLAGITIATRT